MPQSGAQSAPFGFTGELHHDDLVYLRARWYDAGEGTFTARDPFEGFERMPYSLHPYQYGYSAPTLYTDPSGRCIPEDVPWIGEPGCEFVGWDRVVRGDVNWADGQAYAQTVIVDPVVGTVKPTWDVITDAPGARAQVVRGAEYLFTHPVDSAVIVGEGAIMPFTDIYEGITCRDPNQLGRGLSGFAIILGGARLTRGKAAPIQPNTLTTLRRLAQQADRTTPIPPGTSARVAGTLKHSEFARLVRGSGRTDLSTEVVYYRGRVMNSNVRGSVRVDVVEGPQNAPTAIYDFKTGRATLTPSRITQIRSHLPGRGRLPSGNPIPIIEVKP